MLMLGSIVLCECFFFSSRRRHTRCSRDWSSDVCSSDLTRVARKILPPRRPATTRAPNAPVVPSTTAIRRVPPAPANSTGTTIIAPKNTGPSSAEIQTPLLRIRSTNSRRITAQILRTSPSRLGPRCGRRRFPPHEVDEDLVQRRLAELEPRQPRPRAHQGRQQTLRVGAGCELELGILAIVVHPLHNPLVCKQLGCRPGSAVKPDDEMVSWLCPLDVGQRSVHQLPAASDDAQLVAQFLRLLHDVRRKQDRDTIAPQLHHRILQYLRIDGIEPGERLVQHEELGLVQDRRDELHLLLHALRELVHATQAPRFEAQPFKPERGARPCPPPLHALHLGEEHDQVEHAHSAVQPPLLGQVADARRVVPARTRLAEQPHRSLVGRDDVHDAPAGGRLAGAVRATQAGDEAARDREGQTVYGRVTGESLGDPVEREHRGPHAELLRASVSAFQGSRAHLIRTGNFDTPASARSSPSDLSVAAAASPCIMALIRPARMSACGTDFSFSSCVIIDADAWLMEQPRPTKRTSRITASWTKSWRSISSPHSGLLSDTAWVGCSSIPLLRGRR